MLLAEADDALIIGDQRTSKLDRRRNQKPVRRIAVFEMMQLIAAGGSLVTQRHRFDSETIEETLDPCRNGNVEVDPSGVNEKSDLPNRDVAEQNGAAVLPANVDQGTRRNAQSVIATVEPEGDVGVEQKAIGQRSISRPVSASGSTSRAGATTSTPS